MSRGRGGGFDQSSRFGRSRKARDKVKAEPEEEKWPLKLGRPTRLRGKKKNAYRDICIEMQRVGYSLKQAQKSILANTDNYGEIGQKAFVTIMSEALG